jgi:CubicO group peptidase (beta-lactamase class C family)
MNRRFFLLAAMRIVCLGVIALTEPFSLSAQDTTAATEQTLADSLEAVRKEFDLPALTGAIVTREGLQEIASVGVRKIGTDVKVTDKDLWHLGSCTKAMTATMIGTLVADGKLTWDTRLAEIAPPELVEKMDEEFQKITLTHLLTHRSGLPANGAWHSLGSERSLTDQRQELLRRLVSKPLKHPVGTKFLYSNVGYALAGWMAEKVTGKSWESLMQERIFEPLAMTSAGFGVPGTIEQIDAPWGHHKTLLNLGPLAAIQADNAPSLGPAGTVHASMEDWGKFIAVHLTEKNKLIDEAIWQKLHTPPEDADYAFGWGVQSRSWAGAVKGKDGIALSHSGSNTMNYCVCWLAPEKGFAVLIATNTGQANAGLALDKVAGILIERQTETP